MYAGNKKAPCINTRGFSFEVCASYAFSGVLIVGA